MILYLDATAVACLFVHADSSAEARELVEGATIIASSVLAYPEVSAHFADLHHRGMVSSGDHRALRSELDRDWPHFLKLELIEPVWRRAADLAASFVLTGSQAVHISSFLYLAAANRPRPTRFWSAEERVRLAAKAALDADS